MEGSTLKLLNSFTRQKDPFAPNDRRTIKWYSCGPTVYDVSHLGHARCYITFDIIRRILSDYFQFEVYYVMNITDIDDKIIKRARSNYLCDKFIENSLMKINTKESLDLLIRVIEIFIDNYKKRHLDEHEPVKLGMINKIIENSTTVLTRLKANNYDQILLKQSLDRLREIISDEQDVLFAHTVNDHDIFKKLTQKYEQEYHEDMERLDILPPDALTRVSEFIDEIGAYIKRLESNGYAYRSGGSIYFDTTKFDSDPRHSYAKLVREAYGHNRDLDEGEGELSQAHKGEKKSPSDFAVWKKSKIGEPNWITADFEAGRPGWHIECSVMASHLLGENFDIHSGGCDLKFPHHDNEIAQAEAYYNTGKNWVNYFIHSGHLTISGCKMSKSLKNFITIRQALQEYTSRQLRFAFLTHGWAETLDYSENTMKTALTFEKTFRKFFIRISIELRKRLDEQTRFQFSKLSEDDMRLNDEFLTSVNRVDSALCDNFDTRSTLLVLSGLIKELNKRKHVEIRLLDRITSYIRKILEVFGVNFDIDPNLMESVHILAEFRSQVRHISKLGDVKAGLSEILNLCNDQRNHPVIKKGSEIETELAKTLASFESQVRNIAQIDDPKTGFKQILKLCDQLRDEILPKLGVLLGDEEVEGLMYEIDYIDGDTLACLLTRTKQEEQEKRVIDEARRLEKLKLQQNREEKAKIKPSDMFRQQTDKYSKFDDKGMPTHDANGQEISKSALKKLQRLYAEQETRYTKFMAEQGKV